jgi:hypothetical protein
MLRLKRLYIDLGAALAVALVLSSPALGQISQEAPRAATVMGTVTDVNGDVIPNATVVLREVESNDPRTIVATESRMSLRATVFHNALVCILSGVHVVSVKFETREQAEAYVYRKTGEQRWEQSMSGLPAAKGTTVSRFATHGDEPGVVYAANNRGLCLHRDILATRMQFTRKFTRGYWLQVFMSFKTNLANPNRRPLVVFA